MPLFINSCEQFIQNRKNPVFSIIPRQRKFGLRGNGSLDSRPNFRGASALLRGTSRAFSPKRGIRRDAPSVCLAGEGSVTPPRRPLPSGPDAAFSQNQSFTRFFSKNRGFQRQRLWPRSAERGTLYPEKRIFRVNCRPKGGKRGLFAREKAPSRFGDPY